MKNKIISSIILAIIIIATSTLSFADYSTVTMSVVEEPVCTIELEDNSKFEKRLISKDLNNKEVTLQLKVTNENISSKPTGEVMLVLDNSDSMNQTSDIADGKVRKTLVFDSAKVLISKLLEDNDKLKIGIVRFSTNSDASKEATIDDASVVSELSNNVQELNYAIDSITADGSRTDLTSGLQLAQTKFSTENNNKYMIVLTDGIPNVTVGMKNTGTTEDGYYGSQYVLDQTKNELKTISNNNINLITMLTGIDNEDFIPNQDTNKSNKQIIEEVFGTESNPTAGKFYYITDDKIETTIQEDIYNNLLPIEKTLKDIKIVDYFPKEIVDNFDFAYVSKANIGDISVSIDKTNNSITWTIPELKAGETAVVQYKLKLKQNFDSKIVGKIIDTNEKVDVTYKDFDNKDQTKTSDVTPKLKLTEPPKVLPKTGTIILTTLFVIGTSFAVFSLGKIISYNNKIK